MNESPAFSLLFSPYKQITIFPKTDQETLIIKLNCYHGSDQHVVNIIMCGSIEGKHYLMRHHHLCM